MNNKEIDELMCKLLCVGLPAKSLTKEVKEADLVMLCSRARDVGLRLVFEIFQVFMSQSSFIEIEAPVKICGDIHGDYVDRGRNNLETISLLLAYKIKYPNNFFLLRGNHETSAVNRVYGFYEECIRRYSSVRLWQCYQDVFNCMPMVAMVSDRILCMHGGLSPQLTSIKQLRSLPRPVDPMGSCIEMDFLWADPVRGIKGFVPNQRGASYGFGEDVLNEKCKTLDIDLVCRAHQVVQDGYEFFGYCSHFPIFNFRNRKLVTIFSAPHYCGQFNNAAAVLSVDEGLQCSFEILRPTSGPTTKKSIPTFPNDENPNPVNT